MALPGGRSGDGMRMVRYGFVVLMGISCGSFFGAGSESYGAQASPAPLAIRGTLPWHNFLSGPTAWDEQDYEVYLDRLQALGLNFVGFHCYTGGAERYAPYVEPMIRMEYRDVVPLAGFDTSLTARWGYRPLPVRDFPFGLSRHLNLPAAAEAFGARCAVLARDNEDRYRRAQALMRRVLQMAHEREIQMAMGFEFGIHPPEFASIVPPDSWIRGAMLPDPTHPASIEILHATIDNILETYPGLDWIWLWLHEHTMHVGQAQLSGPFKALYDEQAVLFSESGRDEAVFTGIWSLAYLRQAYAYIKQRSPRTRIAIGGWGGGNQLPVILRGLDKILPPDIVFTCLNPNQGWEAQPPFLSEIAAHRPVWAIPWLEGDRALWHAQPRVAMMREQVKLAGQQGLNGVIAIHWRTEETRLNLGAFARFAGRPDDTTSVEQLYAEDCLARYGPEAGTLLAPILTQMDREGWLNSCQSPEYFPYDPQWGRLDSGLREKLADLWAQVDRLHAGASSPEHRGHLAWLKADLEFTLLLDTVGRDLAPAYDLKGRWLSGRIDREQLMAEKRDARRSLQTAPVEKLLRTYAGRLRSKGEQGVFSSLNQRVWLQYLELCEFLADDAKEPAPSVTAQQ